MALDSLRHFHGLDTRGSDAGMPEHRRLDCGLILAVVVQADLVSLAHLIDELIKVHARVVPGKDGLALLHDKVGRNL